ncbi:MAG: exodeoxyribonuclease VII large subunit [Verrucomicrobiota bacterium JB022]|nr:exodeoxyribonuclease VII large subunit [Verrucomicrobiota bacterium JB022]
MRDALISTVQQALSVSELTEKIRETLETGFGEIWVRGEVSNLRNQSSGHVYFSLKDAGAQISAVAFRQVAARLPFQLKDGQQVVAFGRLSVFPPRGGYQLVVQLVVEEGLGRLQAKFEALKRKLADEGLFDPERKQPIPPLPRTVGFVTSPTGAALRDFVSILQRRGWAGTLRVFPARVQGQGAAEEIARQIHRADQGSLCDLLVIGRGGGSLEDLWPFNEEIVVRAVAECSLPVISAVGHEIDYALSDFAADRRAETPSAAAELISSAFLEQRERMLALAERLDQTVDLGLERRSVRFERLRHRWQQQAPRHRLEQGWLRLDDLTNRLGGAGQRHLSRLEQTLYRLERRFRELHPEVAVRLGRERLRQLALRLRASSPEQILQRGYILATDLKGRPITDSARIRPEQSFNLRFRDGEIQVRREVRTEQTELGLE